MNDTPNRNKARPASELDLPDAWRRTADRNRFGHRCPYPDGAAGRILLDGER